MVLALVELAGVKDLRADDDFPTDFAGADVNIGERLFLETRFSQYFFAHCGGDVNANPTGDPVMDTLQTTNQPVPGPFAGQAMNCRQCHLVDELGSGLYGNNTLGNRTYADFARRSPVPAREDGDTITTRNSQVLVDALLPHAGPLFLHYDGQFATVHDLIIGTLTGRNYGWKPNEYRTAVHHIASVIRLDDGAGYLATEARGGRFSWVAWGLPYPGEMSYRNVLSGFTQNGQYLYDPRSLTPQLITPAYRLNIAAATDDQILDAVATLIEAYLRNLVFSQASDGVDFVGQGKPHFNGSPYDVFLSKNGLPEVPANGETPRAYARRLLAAVEALKAPQYVRDPADGHFTTQNQRFVFGADELEGLKIFLREPADQVVNHRLAIGNCAVCHPPPAFSDFLFHNTGATQEEYDALHGAGKFMKLTVPDYPTRQTNYNAFLPATPSHPLAAGPFVKPPVGTNANWVDLGLWNVWANPDFPAPQNGFKQILPQMLGFQIPQIQGVRRTANQIMLTGGGANPGQMFYILQSATPWPAGAWISVATNQCDAAGNFQVALTYAAGEGTHFYQLQLAGTTLGETLPAVLARFKTSNLRDLGQSAPYLHTGRKMTLEEVLAFYRQQAALASQQQVRNADPELVHIAYTAKAIPALAAFLRALNEDYTD